MAKSGGALQKKWTPAARLLYLATLGAQRLILHHFKKLRAKSGGGTSLKVGEQSPKVGGYSKKNRGLRSA